ncbi:MAG: 5-(carboxyamino)imidazole ribonucleotide mutase [Chloroflexi bacterium]|nr:5-(carboxyamino)imidazole ribonucleotide mutase [Chloroflexota bacterium]
MPLVAIVMGSKSDAAAMQPAVDMLKELGIDHQVLVMSAHRTPERVRQFALEARGQGIEVVIAGAGGAAHLAGVIASWTDLPVIGVPLASSDLKGLDALLAMVQMPSGVPVACVAIGGTKNAALLAAQVLGLKYDAVRQAVADYRQRLREG